jgi:hypothetical protein
VIKYKDEHKRVGSWISITDKKKGKEINSCRTETQKEGKEKEFCRT